MSTQKTEVTVSNKTVLRVIAIVVLAFLGVRFVMAMSNVITLVLVAFFLACALNPAVSWVSKRLKSKNRTLATAAAYVTVLLFLVGYFVLVIPPLIGQVDSFVREVPSTVENLKTQDSSVGRAVRKYGLDKQIDDFSRDFGSKISAKPVLDTAGKVGETLVSTLAVLAMSFMMLNEGPGWVAKIFAIQPEDKRKHRKELVTKMYGMVTGYVNGQLIMATIAGAAALVVLLIASSVLGVSVNAVALAGIIAIFGLIPLIGNPIGAVAVILACALSSVNLAIVMAVYFVIYGQIENVTLQPYVQSKQNELTPLTVFVSALVGVSFGGIVGALFAIPIAGCIRILFVDWADRKGYFKNDKELTNA